uniref:Uncharacterized protein n=1 Tax=Anguilla anguilla TaxID=7936 RepID=A0A0E9SF60_ANGAN
MTIMNLIIDRSVDSNLVEPTDKPKQTLYQVYF